MTTVHWLHHAERSASEPAPSPQEGANPRLHELHTQSGPVRYRHQAALDLQLGRVVDKLEMLRDTIRINFLNQEVRDARVELERGGRGDRAGTVVRLNAHVVRLGHCG